MSRENALTCPCCHSTQLTIDSFCDGKRDDRDSVLCSDCGTQGNLQTWIEKSTMAGPLKSLLIQMLWFLNCTSGDVNLGLPRTSAENIARALAEIDPETAAQANMICRGELGQAA